MNILWYVQLFNCYAFIFYVIGYITGQELQTKHAVSFHCKISCEGEGVGGGTGQ